MWCAWRHACYFTPEFIGEDVGLPTGCKDGFEALAEHAGGHLIESLLAVTQLAQLPDILQHTRGLAGTAGHCYGRSRL